MTQIVIDKKNMNGGNEPGSSEIFVNCNKQSVKWKQQ